MTKYPVVIPYINSGDTGRELRYTLRSLKNLTNFNGEVFIIGDTELWLQKVTSIRTTRKYGKPYLDQVYKMQIACALDEMPDKFIAMMDDIYITEPLEAGVYIRGDLNTVAKNLYQKTKVATRIYLENRNLPTVDYECHAPMLVEKEKLKEALNLIDDNKLQWRSIYGNLFSIQGIAFEDKKTRTNELPNGKIISTNYYTSELDTIFPTPSKYEADI